MDANRTCCADSLDRLWCQRAVPSKFFLLSVLVGPFAFDLSCQVRSSSDKQFGAIFRLRRNHILLSINEMTIQYRTKICERAMCGGISFQNLAMELNLVMNNKGCTIFRPGYQMRDAKILGILNEKWGRLL
jgi:hypothetical protein